ncbi:testis-expressed sequence 36 protein [Biomphalaria pfeifferi]|uniref:Testis-expressed sequence 36 protein n=1 Tax=Biomphalaria pfeifferi TaxID=112525 RepID=A0AAD8BDZ6_BIOPF|nr:testis-expressed sequence 36 protein [Biomphalaria pfeifferi]
MTKGRNFTHATDSDGLWYRHRQVESRDVDSRLGLSTSTREMLEAPFSAPVRPSSPPTLYKQKEESLHNQEYPFTQLNNRNFFQNRGEYFGNGRDTRCLGRRVHPHDKRLHHTENSFLHHRSNDMTPFDYNPITATSFRHPEPTEAPTRRRFPKIYQEPKVPADWKTQHLTTWSASPYRTPLCLLALSQEPFLDHNPWKYCHHGNTKVYPQYNRKKFPHVPNILNRYGPDFTTVTSSQEN